MFFSLCRRVRRAEFMDQPQADPRELLRSLRFIRRVNRFLGYNRVLLRHLERFSHGWKRGEPIEILDLATGSADVPRAILRWGRRNGWDLRIVAIDFHPFTARLAAAESAGPHLRIIQADALDPPFAEGSFDYVLASLFLHHLSEDEAVRLLRAMDRLSRRGMIVADLLRHRRAYVWISLLTLLSNRMVRHDARASVAHAFTRDEALRLRDDAGLSYLRYYRHFGHRFVLSGGKRQLSDAEQRPI
jgi:hypothetical protein